MTEFKRTTQAVDEIEALIPSVLDGSGNVERLGQLVAQTDPVVQKLDRKASETDPNKQTYGPGMRDKVKALASRWGPIAELARDVFGQRGVDVNALAAAAATTGTPSNTPAWTGLHATTQPATASQLWSPPAGLPAVSSSIARPLPQPSHQVPPPVRTSALLPCRRLRPAHVLPQVSVLPPAVQHRQRFKTVQPQVIAQHQWM